MTTSVHKFVVDVTAVPDTVRMDETATIVRVEAHAESAGHVTFWAIVDTAAEPKPRQFVATGTGYDVPEGVRYVGTAVGPVLVWHLWEVAA